MTDEDIQVFNRWSGRYEDSFLQRLYFDHVHEALLSALEGESEPRCIADIGCGTGRLLRKIKGRFPNSHLMGIDPAEGMINKARKMMPDATFLVSGAESLPLPDESVDLVISTLSFHHWKYQAEGTREIHRVMRPGGTFLLADALHPIFLARIFRHGQVRTAAETRDICTQAGLNVLQQQLKLLGHILITKAIKRS
jgi:ubiquinone/menaquinone biosynthesis C-methylase UbiE